MMGFTNRTAAALCLAAVTLICGCRKTTNPAEPQTEASGGEVGGQLQQDTYYEDFDGEPYAVRTVLREYTAVDPDTKTGAYGRYTELIVEGQAPDTFRSAVEACNRRAAESVKTRADEAAAEQAAASSGEAGSGSDGYRYVTIGYISAVTRADQTAFSFLETEFTMNGGKGSSDIVYRFRGVTCDTESGEEIALADLVGDEEACSGMLREALSSKYGITDLAATEPSAYAWTADALGVRFYFHSEAVSAEKLRELKEYSPRAVTVGLPYAGLTGKKAEALSAVPESYIAMMDKETEYDLPHGNMTVQLTGTDDAVSIRIRKDSGETSDLQIEYADRQSDFYMIRAEGGFYLFRERIGYQEGFFYDFSKPDGGFGRFAYNTCQYFDSFLREIRLAVPYNPYCVHMAEIRRSFGETSYDSSSFVPNGHYAFPNDPGARYKRFLLTDGSLQIDTYNVACRLLEDFTAIGVDAEGNETGEVTVQAGRTLFFESVTGEAARYDDPPKRSYYHPSVYVCRLTDGSRIRFESSGESTVYVGDKGYMNRFSEPISLGEAQLEAEPAPAETFRVRIGGKDYPLIPDYSKPDHTGEEIDFGEDIWWQVEGYTGRYVCTEEDLKDMQGAYFTQEALSDPENKTELVIGEDGQVVFICNGETFTGSLPKKRYYRTNVYIAMESETAYRTFHIRLREGEYHSVPGKIEFYSEGEPATNEPSKVPPIAVYLTHVKDR